MIGEIGEVIDIIKKHGGEKASQDAELREHLIEELADVLMYYNDVFSKSNRKGDYLCIFHFSYCTIGVKDPPFSCRRLIQSFLSIPGTAVRNCHTGDAFAERLPPTMRVRRKSSTYAQEIRTSTDRVAAGSQPLQTKSMEVIQMDNNSFAHTKWNCKYHIVFTPKYRRQIIAF